MNAAGPRKAHERCEMIARRGDGSIREIRVEEYRNGESPRIVSRRFFRFDGSECDSWRETATPEEIAQVLHHGGDPDQHAVKET